MTTELMVTGTTDSNFQFSAISTDRLGASEYTLVTLVLDMSTSVTSYKKELMECIDSVVQACRKSPRAENLMFRLVTFNNNTYEEHGFKPLFDIDPNDYMQVVDPRGMTALYDATINAAEATKSYGSSLMDDEFDTNALIIIATDGDNNAGKYRDNSGIDAIRSAIESITQEESAESVRTILVGVNTRYNNIKSKLTELQTRANLDQYIDIEDADGNSLAKLADFISKSISAQSQALGTGGPSQALTF